MPYKDKDKQREYQRNCLAARRLKWFTENGPCRHCGSNENLEVDHVNPNDKVSHRIWSWTESKRLEELKKCQVLCKNCHFEKTLEENKLRHKGVSRPETRIVSNEKILKVKELTEKGLSEKEACSIVGISRGTYSSIKIRKLRPEVFNS